MLSVCRSPCRWVAVALIVCLLCVAGTVLVLRCARDRIAPNSAMVPSLGETTPAAKADEEAGREALIVLDGATRVEHGRGAYGSLFVSFSFTEAYPAPKAIQQISSHLRDLAWVPLKEDWLNPGLPSSHVRGWTDFGDNTGNSPRHVHQWGAQWQDSRGNLVAYSLRYAYPEGGPRELRSLWVNGTWFPARSVKIMRRQILGARVFDNRREGIGFPGPGSP